MQEQLKELQKRLDFIKRKSSNAKYMYMLADIVQDLINVLKEKLKNE